MNNTIECCGVKVSIGSNHFAIVCTYRPPNADFQTFLDGLSSVLEVAATSSSRIVLCGDLNVDPARDVTNTSKLTDVLDSYELVNDLKGVPTREYTYQNGITSSSPIDYMVTYNQGNVVIAIFPITTDN